MRNYGDRLLETGYETLEFNKIREKIALCASSDLGKELAFEVEPQHDLKQLLKKHNQITELRDILDYDLYPPIDGISDIRPLLKKIKLVGSILNPNELGQILQNLVIVRKLQHFFSVRTDRIPNLKEITFLLKPLNPAEKEIERCIDVAGNTVKDGASPTLAGIRRQIERAQSSVRNKIASKLKQLSERGMLQENVISIRDGRFVLVVKEEFKRKVKGLIHGQSASGSSYFIEPMDVFEDNNFIRELQTRESREIEKILLTLTSMLRENSDVLESNIHVLGELDLVYAKSVFSKEISGFQPELVDEKIISIAQGRHPLLVLRMGEKQVVPLDLNLGEKFCTLIISGPNAGGKTVALKTIGLLTLMARCGLHIPALPHSKIGSITHVYACIGDQQSIENDLSTFSSHINTLGDIAEHADSNSLVLVDEIGTGTDPEEGTAIAMSLLEDLTRRKCLSVVTTHLGALKAFAFRTDGIENASLEFDAETLQATYAFRVGIPGSSYAFDIAQRMGYPVELIKKSRELIGTHKDKLEGLILDLEEKVQHYKNLTSGLKLKESELKSLQKLYSERSAALKRDEKKIKGQAVKEAEEIISQANSLIEKAIKDIKEQNARREAIVNAKTIINEQKAKIKIIKKQTREPEEKTPLISVEPGEYVKWKNSNTTGKIISKVDKKGRVYVQLNGVKMKVPVSELEKAKNPKKRKTLYKLNAEDKQVHSSEIDLRGLNAEEAREAVDRFIDEALLSGFKEIRIIHGKGTGKLRKDISEFLKGHRQVLQFRLGYWNEGDSGVTVVELKK